MGANSTNPGGMKIKLVIVRFQRTNLSFCLSSKTY